VVPDSRCASHTAFLRTAEANTPRQRSYAHRLLSAPVFAGTGAEVPHAETTRLVSVVIGEFTFSGRRTATFTAFGVTV
jgi:hypothetical protein